MQHLNIRNFCIIAHIDHGKSTLADRLLDLTNTISERDKKDQILDSMDLERERGITIKMQPVVMRYRDYYLNLIDTPGHVDFTYEVSRALAAVEGAILLVDATQGIQAQTLANLYLALEQNLAIIPVINKIDLPAANVAQARQELAALLSIDPDTVIAVSAKTGENVAAVLEAVILHVPAPAVASESEVPGTRALIFDSYFDHHRGVVCDVRVFDGSIRARDQIFFYGTSTKAEVKEVGVYGPKPLAVAELTAGLIGYVVTGIREPLKCQVGDTIIKLKVKSEKLKVNVNTIVPLPGYKRIKPVVFANIYPKDQSKYVELREALLELKLNDSSLDFEPASVSALGKGFKIGVLGLLHLDIVKERLLREYSIALVLTVPQVEYHLKLKIKNEKLKINENTIIVTAASEFPTEMSNIISIEEPWVDLEIVSPETYIGELMQLVIERRGQYLNTSYLVSNNLSAGLSRVILHFKLPLAELLTDFYDKLKSISAGYASLNYDLADFKSVDLVKLEFLIAGELREALSVLVPRVNSYTRGCQILVALQKEIPPHQFEVRLQAKIGGKIIASERIKALRKNVTAGLYGGDVTRKMKLLKKQKKGKQKMMEHGTVDIPSSAYLAVLKR